MVQQKSIAKTMQGIVRNYQLYILILPAFVYFFIFCYLPMYGVQIAFKDFIANLGIWGSPWVGLKHFERFFNSFNFLLLLKNTLGISIYSLVAGFPMPIILALLLNEIKSGPFKKIVQTVTYAPNFISLVVMVGMLITFFSSSNGLVNILLSKVGMEPVAWLSKGEYFKSLYVWSGVWQSTGWGSIIYLAVLAGVDPQMHEAAIIDGASRIKRMWHINLPSIMPTIIIMLILSTGSLMNVGYEKIYLMQNPLILDTSEVISTYTYKVGLLNSQYSFSAAVGLFNSVINLIILLIVNAISSKISETSLW